MTRSSAGRLKRAVDRAIKHPLNADERRAMIEFIRTELPAFCVSGRTTYLVLGSYRDDYEENLRLVQSDLNKRIDTFAAVVGDLMDPDFGGRSAFAVKLHLSATYADWLVGVYEKETGGEAPELGVVHTVYFGKTHILPRDYVWMTGDNIDSPEAAYRTALEIAFSDDLDPDEKRAELEGLYNVVKENDVEITPAEIKEVVRERKESDTEPATYSWVHISFFRDFERAEQCHPWHTREELRTQAHEVPGPSQPTWEADWTPDEHF